MILFILVFTSHQIRNLDCYLIRQTISTKLYSVNKKMILKYKRFIKIGLINWWEKMKICKSRCHRWVEPRPWHQLLSELVNTSLGFTPIVQFQLPYRWAEPSARPSSRTFETSQFEFFFLLDYIFWGKFMKILISSLTGPDTLKR